MSNNIVGVEEVTAMFKDLSANLKKKVIKGALTTAIELIAADVRANTPEKIGLLKASLETKVTVSSNGTKGKATAGFGIFNQIALMVEYGHLDIGHLPDKKEIGVVAPHPFILPAFDRQLPGALAAFDDAVAEAVIAYER